MTGKCPGFPDQLFSSLRRVRSGARGWCSTKPGQPSPCSQTRLATAQPPAQTFLQPVWAILSKSGPQALPCRVGAAVPCSTCPQLPGASPIKLPASQRSPLRLQILRFRMRQPSRHALNRLPTCLPIRPFLVLGEPWYSKQWSPSRTPTSLWMDRRSKFWQET